MQHGMITAIMNAVEPFGYELMSLDERDGNLYVVLKNTNAVEVLSDEYVKALNAAFNSPEVALTEDEIDAVKVRGT